MTSILFIAVGSVALPLFAVLMGANYYVFGFACAVAGWSLGLAYAATRMI